MFTECHEMSFPVLHCEVGISRVRNAQQYRNTCFLEKIDRDHDMSRREQGFSSKMDTRHSSRTLRRNGDGRKNLCLGRT